MGRVGPVELGHVDQSVVAVHRLDRHGRLINVSEFYGSGDVLDETSKAYLKEVFQNPQYYRLALQSNQWEVLKCRPCDAYWGKDSSKAPTKISCNHTPGSRNHLGAMRVVRVGQFKVGDRDVDLDRVVDEKGIVMLAELWMNKRNSAPHWIKKLWQFGYGSCCEKGTGSGEVDHTGCLADHFTRVVPAILSWTTVDDNIAGTTRCLALRPQEFFRFETTLRRWVLICRCRGHNLPADWSPRNWEDRQHIFL